MRGVKWTQEELDFLESNWGIKSMCRISKELDRSVNAIRIKAIQLGLGRYLEARQEITFLSLIRTIYGHQSYSWFLQRFQKLGLKVIRKKVINGKFYMVNIQDFWKWAENNKHILNFSKFELNSLGKEPTWVDEKRRADLLSPSKNKHRTAWSTTEVNRLLFMVNAQRYTYADISKDINRSQSAIKRKLYDLKVKSRPIPLNTKINWTKEENELLYDMYVKGYDAFTIAKTLNKSELSISDRVRNIKNTGDVSMHKANQKTVIVTTDKGEILKFESASQACYYFGFCKNWLLQKVKNNGDVFEYKGCKVEVMQ